MRCDRIGWAGVRARDREAVYIVGWIGRRTQCPARVNSLAGHSTPLDTMTLYAHLLAGDDEAAADTHSSLL